MTVKKTKFLPLATLSVLAPSLRPQVPESVSIDMLPSEFELDSIADARLMFGAERYIPQWSRRLSEDDYREVAAELGVEVAAIKAVVDIETGRTHDGFWEEGKPLINFDLSIYRQYAPRHGVNLNDARTKAPLVFRSPDVRKYGSRQAAQYARLEQAIAVDEDSALESTFWGMFQIGGFNWKKCGTSSVKEFVELMSRSERDQLELFAAFCKNSGLVKYIKSKNWAAFSLRYNGPGYRTRGYHTKMAAAYKKFKNQK